MFTTNSLGLPNLLEADLKNNSLYSILDTFLKLGEKSNHLVIKNYNLNELQLKEITKYYGLHNTVVNKKHNLLFISRPFKSLSMSNWSKATNVKRRLPVFKQVIEDKDTLFIQEFKTVGNTYPRKGISEEQFKTEIFKKEYEVVVIYDTYYNVQISLFLDHLKKSNFKKMISVPAGVFNNEVMVANKFHLLMKDE